MKEEYLDKIEALLASKSFEQLSSEESSFILQHMTESEYTEQYGLLKNTSAYLENETVPPTPSMPSLAARPQGIITKMVPLRNALSSGIAACLVIGFLSWNLGRTTHPCNDSYQEMMGRDSTEMNYANLPDAAQDTFSLLIKSLSRSHSAAQDSDIIALGRFR